MFGLGRLPANPQLITDFIILMHEIHQLFHKKGCLVSDGEYLVQQTVPT